VTILSLDPGKKIGRALWSDDGLMLFADECDLDTALDYLANARMHTIVVEDWRLFKRQTEQTGSKMEASQLIGAVKLWAKLEDDRKMVIQPSSILPVSALHMGIKLPKGHTPDRISAMLHGHYYLVSQGVLEPHEITVE
jgi:hypothetical protein